MRSKKTRLAVLILALLVLLCGCTGTTDLVLWRLEHYYQSLDLVKYEDMEYTRPDMALHDETLSRSCSRIGEAKDLQTVIDSIYEYYDVYDAFYTSYTLANIGYSADLMDIFWEQEYTYCAEQTATVDAGLDSLYRALAACEFREELETDEYFGEGFFDGYEGESIWDETFLSLMEQETELVNRYYDLSAQALEAQAYSDEYYDTYGPEMVQLLVELVALRQEIAAYAGYDSYEQFTYDLYYYRDYTPEQVAAYLEEIRQELVPLYTGLSGEMWSVGSRSCSTSQTYAYLKSCVKNMGGLVESAFGMLDKYGLYDIGYGENKYNASFETYFYTYYEPFIFMNSTLSTWDKLTLVHEFGHFANDYACLGSYAGTDVEEVFSQGLEYLSLFYADGGGELETLKMADCLCIYVEQAAYFAFEQQLYALQSGELTAENVVALFRQVGQEYGFGTWDFHEMGFVDVTHLYTSPMYIISYVVSNDAAFQLYQMEQAETGAGLALYQQMLYSSDAYFLGFVEDMGLESPFAEGRIQTIRQTLEEVLK